MDDSLQNVADNLFQKALESSGARDPREFYRGRLRDLKAANSDGYDLAVAYYQEELIPSIATNGREPVEAWQAYGARLASWTNPGHAVEIDGSGLAHPHEPPAKADRLVLHLPDGKGRAIVVGLPVTLTTAQRATYDLLVSGKQKLRAETSS
jgi:hypothetical protein